MKPALAIVGMSCRYPDARGPNELWENALAGRRAFRRLPPASPTDAAGQGVVDVPITHPKAVEWIAAESRAAVGYSEAYYDEAGTRCESVGRACNCDGSANRCPARRGPSQYWDPMSNGGSAS